MNVAELYALLGFKYAGGNDATRFKNDLKGIEDKAQHAAMALNKIALAISGAFAGAAVGQKIGAFIADITQTNAAFEKYEATLKTIEGSSEKARASMDWIREFGETTPYEMGELTQAFVRMRANGLDPMNGSFKTIGDTASAMGVSFMQVVEAVADAATGEGERLKELGIKQSVAGDQVTYSWQENGKELTKTVKKTGAEMVSGVLGIMKRFDGAMIEQNKTWGGMVSNLSDRWTGFLLEIGEAGYYDDVKRRLNSVLDLVDDWATSGTTKRAAKVVSDSLVGAMNTASHLAMQGYRIGRGFYVAADGVAALVSQMTGLSKGMSAAGLGAGLLATSAIGRGAMMAAAKRVPMLASLLLADDLLSALNGDDSWIGSTEQGAAAIDKLKASLDELNKAGSSFNSTFADFATKIAGSFNIPEKTLKDLKTVEDWGRTIMSEAGKGMGVGPDGQKLMGQAGGHLGSTVDTYVDRIKLLVADPLKLVETRIADLVNNGTMAVNAITTVMTTVQSALSRLNEIFFSKAEAQAAPKAAITATGRTTRAPTSRTTFTPMARLERDGMIEAEGRGAQYGVDPDRLANGAAAFARFAVDLTNFTDPANQAKLLLKSMESTFTAKIDVNTDAAMAKINVLKAEIGSLDLGIAGMRRRSHSQQNDGRPFERAKIVESPASR